MAIARYENIEIYNVTNSIDVVGQQTTVNTLWFKTRATVKNPQNNLQITGDTRIYTDLLQLTLNYTPNTRTIFNSQNLYSIKWRDNFWRISNVMESNDRMNVIFMCYRNDPVVPV